MTQRRKNHSDIPTLRLHKSSGRGRVRLNGQDCYVGKYGTVEAEEQYNKLIAEWLMYGRQLPPSRRAKKHETTEAEVEADDSGGGSLTVGQLVNQYLEWARRRYTNSNQAEVSMYSSVPLTDAYSSLPADQFSPNKLRAVRALMIQRGWLRSSINRRVSLIRGIFSWGVGRELIPEATHSALTKVEPIEYGRDGIRESVAKGLVTDETIESIRPHLSSQVYALLQLAMLSGARMGELVQITPGLLNPVEVNGVRILEFSPPSHKTKHHGLGRIIRFGPRASMILQPFLNRDSDVPCFQPIQAEVERRRRLHLARVTPMSCGNTIGSNRKPKPQRQPGTAYTTSVVRRAIQRAVNAHNKEHSQEQIEAFTPHRLRHSALTRIRDEYGFEAAMSAAGHHTPSMTELYTEKSSKAGRKLAAQAG